MEPTGKTYVGSDELYADVQRTMRLCAEMNSGYHTESEVRDCLREITRSEVPDTVRVFTPLNINYGPGVCFGDDCFLNFGCTLLAIGGITVGDGAFIGPHCVLATEYHPGIPILLPMRFPANIPSIDTPTQHISIIMQNLLFSVLSDG